MDGRGRDPRKLGIIDLYTLYITREWKGGERGKKWSAPTKRKYQTVIRKDIHRSKMFSSWFSQWFSHEETCIYIYTCVKITRMGDKNYASVSGARVAINCKYLFRHREDPIYRYLIKSPKILRSDVTGFRNRWKFLLSSFHDSSPKILTPTVAKTHTYSNAFLEESSLHFLHTSLTHDFSSWKKKKKKSRR